jgi:hypothetical protein
MRHRWQDILFAALVVAALALAVFLALVWSGHFVSDESSVPLRSESAPKLASTTPAARPSQNVATTPTTPTKPRRPVAANVRITLLASRGDCWVSAHEGSSSAGRVVLERLLAQGETVTLHGRKIWLSLGAAGNVDLSVNGRPRVIPTGTTSIVLG